MRKQKGDFNFRMKRWHTMIFSAVALVLSLVVAVPTASSFQVYEGPNIKLWWDNTLKYSAAWRVNDQDHDLISDLNSDDGDRNFDSGFISNRFDVLSELDIIYQRKFGVRVSAAAWYDSFYLEDNDNDSPLTANSFSVPHDEFTDDTEELHGKDAEILDAFVFGSGDVGDLRWNIRLGQHTLLWGETLFSASTGIMAGMGPFDVVKVISVPNTKAKELFRPVPQVSWGLQLPHGLSLAGFYQFEWEKSRLPGAGSYFQLTDFFDEGGERLVVAGRAAFFRGNDMEAKDSGQWGISVRYETVFADFGLYYYNYHERTPQFYLYPLRGANLAIGKIGEYALVYPEDIQLIGVSWMAQAFDASVAGDVNYRHDMPLVSNPGMVLPGMRADNDDHPLYATGDTLHATLNCLYIVPESMAVISDSAMLMGEIKWERYVSINKNRSAMASGRVKDAWGFQLLAIPSYMQVVPGVDLNVPIGFGYSPKGNSAMHTDFGYDDGGNWNIGVDVTYLQTWFLNIKYTDYFGSTRKQPYADRDFISFAVEHTF